MVWAVPWTVVRASVGKSDWPSKRHLSFNGRKMTKRKWIFVGAVTVAALGTGAWYATRAGAEDAPPYRLGMLALGDVESTVTSTGRLQALQSVAIGTQVSGQVMELFADYNDRG